MKVLSEVFYDCSPLAVAPDLLGKILVRKLDNQILSGRIVEVEAYLAGQDEASHAFKGRTKRNESLFKKAGHAYVYSIHQQKCLDIVTEKEGVPTSVLIRGLEPLEGIEFMKQFRNKEKLTDLTSGPGKLTQALQIGKEFDGVDMTSESSLLYVLDDGYVQEKIVTAKRVGITKAVEKEYRFYIAGNSFVSKK